jgi:hypothetical protein
MQRPALAGARARHLLWPACHGTPGGGTVALANCPAAGARRPAPGGQGPGLARRGRRDRDHLGRRRALQLDPRPRDGTRTSATKERQRNSPPGIPAAGHVASPAGPPGRQFPHARLICHVREDRNALPGTVAPAVAVVVASGERHVLPMNARADGLSRRVSVTDPELLQPLSIPPMRPRLMPTTRSGQTTGRTAGRSSPSAGGEVGVRQTAAV